MAVRSAHVNVMAEAAAHAARILRRDFGEIEQLLASRKGAAPLAARTTRRVTETLAHKLERARRGPPLFDAEPGRGNEPAWLVAPLDGAGNLARGVPAFAIVIGAREAGKLAAGVIYDALRGDLYWAERGRGAFVNQRRLRSAAAPDPESALIALAPPPGLATARLATAAGPADMRLTGAPALDLAWVASGRFHGFVGSASPPTLAVGALLCREAGALTEQLPLEGARAPLMLAAEGRLITALLHRITRLAAAAPRPRRETAT